MEFKTNYSDFGIDVYEPTYDPEMYEPVDGFVPHQVLPLSELFKRIQVGQPVPTIHDGVFEDEQVFDDAMIDSFDVLDYKHEFESKVVQVGEEKELETKPLTDVEPGTNQD